MSSRSLKEDNELETLDEMIAEIIVDAYGDDEQLGAFHQALEATDDDIDLSKPVELVALTVK